MRGLNTPGAGLLAEAWAGLAFLRLRCAECWVEVGEAGGGILPLEESDAQRKGFCAREAAAEQGKLSTLGMSKISPGSLVEEALEGRREGGVGDLETEEPAAQQRSGHFLLLESPAERSFYTYTDRTF